MIDKPNLLTLIGGRFPAYHLSDETWRHIGNWVHDFTTGAPMAGLFAVGGSLIALYGISNQVNQTREANRLSGEANETSKLTAAAAAQKSVDDQWWSTLQWAYKEARDFKAGTKEEETRAVVAILRSLAEQPKLSNLQSSTVAEVLNMFEKSTDEVVQDQVDGAYQALNRTEEWWSALALRVARDTSTTTLGDATEAAASLRKHFEDGYAAGSPLDYEHAVRRALHNVAPGSAEVVFDAAVKLRHRGQRTRLIADALVVAPDSPDVLIEVKWTKGPLSRQAVAQLFSLAELDLSAQKPEPGVNPGLRALLISNEKLTASAHRLLNERSDVLGHVVWKPGDSVEPIRLELARLMSSS